MEILLQIWRVNWQVGPIILVEKFDLVVSFFVLHWIEDQLAVLKNIKNALKPNGKTIIITAAIQNKYNPIGIAFDNLEQKGEWNAAIENSRKMLHPKSEQDFEKLLDQAEFKNKKVKVVQKPSTSQTLEVTAQSLMRSIPHSTKLPPDQALKFSRALAENIYKQLDKEPDEPIKFESSFLLIEAH